MKETILLSALTLLSATTFAAPKHTRNTVVSHISAGPIVSLGGSWLSNASNQKFKFAPAAGIGLVYSRNEHLGFGAQILVSHEGNKQQYTTSSGETYSVAVNPVYLRIPLHLIYFFGNYGDRVRPKIYAGPSFAFKVDEHHFYSDDRLKPLENNTTDVFKGFDAGLTAGVGANIRIGHATWLNLDGGYYHGLTDVTNTSGNNSNRNLRLNLGLMWGL